MICERVEIFNTFIKITDLLSCKEMMQWYILLKYKRFIVNWFISDVISLLLTLILDARPHFRIKFM